MARLRSAARQAKLWLRAKGLSLLRRLRKPPLPRNPDGRLYVHLGCGMVKSPEYVNVDMLRAPHIHHIQDVRNLSNFATESADLVYACHVLEHFSPEEAGTVLREWCRVLKAGGVLRISAPDFEKLLRLYEDSGRDATIIQYPLMGMSREFHGHRLVFDKKLLEQMLRGAGLDDVREWDSEKVLHHDFEDASSLTIRCNDKEYPVSLNLEGTKKTTWKK